VHSLFLHFRNPKYNFEGPFTGFEKLFQQVFFCEARR